MDPYNQNSNLISNLPKNNILCWIIKMTFNLYAQTFFAFFDRLLTFQKAWRWCHIKVTWQEKLALKFGYSEKATKFEKIFHLKFDATQIFSNFVAFSEYPNFK